MDEEELSWLLAFIILSAVASATTLYQVFISPLFEKTFHLFIFQIPAVVAFLGWLYIRFKNKRKT